MNEDLFLKTMRLIDDDLLEEAYEPIRKKPHRRVLYAAIAACLCLVIGIGVWSLTDRSSQGTTIQAAEFGLRMELPDGAAEVSHQVTGENSDMPVLEAAFRVEEQDYLYRMANTAEPVDLTRAEGSTVGMMNWQTTQLTIEYRQQEDSSWVSWYDTENQVQWCLGCEDPVSLLTTAQVLVQNLGYSMAVAPPDAEQIRYRAVYYEDLTVGETSFVWDGSAYTYRMAATNAISEPFADISDLELPGEEQPAQVLWCPARITVEPDGRGKVVWFDVVPGLLYSLTMDSGASEEALMDMALTVFAPAQEMCE